MSFDKKSKYEKNRRGWGEREGGQGGWGVVGDEANISISYDDYKYSKRYKGIKTVGEARVIKVWRQETEAQT